METSRAPAPARSRLANSMIAHRFATGLILATLFVAVLWVDEFFFAPWFPTWLVLACVFMSAAAVEMINLLAATTARPSANTVFGGVIALVLANWVPHVGRQVFGATSRPLPAHAELALTINSLAWPFLAFVGVLMVAFLVQSVQFNRPGGTLATLAGSILAIAYLGLLVSFVIQLRWVGDRGHGLVAVMLLMATAKGADIGAYTLGRLAGHHKLWPQLSPNKTVEGAVGGLLLATLAAVGVVEGARLFGIATFSLPAAIGFGLVVGTAAQLGDLMESMIKRDCERKDASDALPGFGGVLDVIDSVLFSGPVAFSYWMVFGP